MAIMFDYGDDHVGGNLKRSTADEAREMALAFRFERMFVQQQQQANSEQKGKKKKKKKIKNKKKKKGKLQGAGDTQNPLSRGFTPGGSQIQGRAQVPRGHDGKDEIAIFVQETCKFLGGRRRRGYIWEATKMLGTSAVAQLVSEVEAIEKNGGQLAPDGNRRNRVDVFWNILQAKLGDSVYEEIMSKAEAFARERLEAEPRPQKRQMEEPRSGSKRRKLPDEVFQALTRALSGDMSRPKRLEVPASPDLVAESAIHELSLRFNDTVRFS